MNAIGVIEGPQGAAAHWSSIDWAKIRRHVSRLQARIVKAVPVDRWVLHGALSRLEPCAVKIACTVLRGRGGSNVTPLPDYRPSRSLSMAGSGGVPKSGQPEP